MADSSIVKKRNPIAQALLSLFIPIWVYWWFYVTANDIRNGGTEAPSFKLIGYPTLIYFAYLLILLIAQAAMTPSPGSSSPVILNVMFIFLFPLVLAFIVCTVMYYYRFSVAVDKATKGKVNTAVTLILILVFAPIAVFIAQDGLNKLDTPAPNAPITT